MTYHLQLITPPAVEPLTLAEAKDYLYETGNGQDAVITRLIRTAREMAEQITRRALITQVWQLRGEGCLSRLALPRWPVQAVVSLVVDGVTVSASEYSLLPGDDAQLRLKTAVRGDWLLTIRCGYGDSAGSVPQTLRDWIGIKVNTLFEHREEVAVGAIIAEHKHVERMLDHYRIPHV